MRFDLSKNEEKNIKETTATKTDNIYEKIVDVYYEFMNKETGLNSVKNLVHWKDDATYAKYLDTTFFDIYVKLNIAAGKDKTNEVAAMAHFIAVINADNPNNFITFAKKYYMREDYIRAIAKSCPRTLWGDNENNNLFDSDNGMLVFAGEGNDFVRAAGGNDIVYGEGADTYYIGANDGNNLIDSNDASEKRIEDKILFGEGINATDLELQRQGNNLVLNNVASGQQTTILNGFCGVTRQLVNLEFADESSAKSNYDEVSIAITPKEVVEVEPEMGEGTENPAEVMSELDTDIVSEGIPEIESDIIPDDSDTEQIIK